MRRLALLIPIAALPLVPVGCSDGSSSGEYRPLTSADSKAGAVAEDTPATADTGADSATNDRTTSTEADPPAGDEGGDESGGGVTLVAAEVDPTPTKTVDPPAREPRIEALVPEPQFRLERGGALRVTFDDLDLKRVIGIDRPTVDTPRDLPPWFGELAGRRIRVRGFMKPFEFSQGLTGFTFVRDNGVCCFGPNAKLYDKVQVRLRDGTTTDFIDNTAFDVEGVFRIEPTEFLDELLYFYHLDDAVVLRR